MNPEGGIQLDEKAVYDCIAEINACLLMAAEKLLKLEGMISVPVDENKEGE